MSYTQLFSVTGFHSCDKKVGLNVLNGNDNLIVSNNTWDWLAHGIYFWEGDPERALQYAIENANGIQFNKKRIETPFILGANINLGNCLNLSDSSSASVLKEAYYEMERIYKKAATPVPQNEGDKRLLDCAVFKFIHQSRKHQRKKAYDTIRCAFAEGGEIYPGANFSTKGHVQICVINPKMITGYFLPRPIAKFNPYLKKKFVKTQSRSIH